MSVRLQSIIRGNYAYRTAFDRQQAGSLRLLSLVLGALCIIAIVTLPFRGLAPGSVVPSVAITIFVLLSVVLTVVLLNQGNLSGARQWTVVAMFLGVTIIYITISQSASVILFTIPLIAAGTLLGTRGLLAAIALTVVTYVGTTQFAGLGLLPGISLEYASPLDSIPFAVAALVADGILLALFAASQRAVLADQNQTLENNLQHTFRIGEAMASAVDVDEVLQKTVEALRDDFDFDYVRAFLVESSGLPVLHARAGFTRADEEAAQPSEAINGVIESGQPLQMPAIEDKSGVPSAALLLPLTLHGQTLGVLDIQSRRVNAFNRPVVQMLTALAVQVASAVQRTRTSAELKASARDHEQLSALMRETRRQLQTVNQDARSNTWQRVVRMRGQVAIGFRWQADTGALTSDNTLTLSLDRATTLTAPELRTEQGEQILALPIVLRGQVLGAMEFRAPAAQPWTSRSIDLARTISQRLALALDNARLYEQARTLADREQTVNLVASRLQARTDIETVIAAAAESFQAALGATRASIRLGVPDHLADSVTQGNGAKS